MKRKFYLYKRGKFYYASLINPQTKKKLPGKSTKEASFEAASEVATRWYYHGYDDKTNQQPIDVSFEIDSILNRLRELSNLTSTDIQRFLNLFQSKGLLTHNNGYSVDSESFIEFLFFFWNYEKSPYVLEKLSYGHQIGRRRCHEAVGTIERHWKPYFHNKTLLSIDKNSLVNFSLSLKERELSAKTINNIINYGTVALKWAYNNGHILTDPTVGLHKFSGQTKKRGILTDKEITELFLHGNWHGNVGAKIGNLLAMQSGLRSGEIIALQRDDIKTDKLIVRHSFSYWDGLKSTKNGEIREVPLIPKTRDMILKYSALSPHKESKYNFIFFQEDCASKPMRQETLRKRLIIALESIGISAAAQSERGICFHSWRHYYATKMASVLDKRTMKLTGHKAVEVFEAYANHMNEEDFKRAYDTTMSLFSNYSYNL